ncbi:MAG: hypothetical protein ACI4XM_04265 [Candidatus Coprovivens sp.]
MTLSDKEYRNIIDFLEANTTYDIGELVTRTDGQLYNMKKRIEEAIIKYPEEIYKFYEEHPDYHPRHTLEELKKMKYNELANIRKSLKIRKRKKVKKVEEAPSTVTKARQALKQQSTIETIKNIVASNVESEEKEQDEYQFLTRAEATAMYGEDITDEYLEERGFKLYEPIGRIYNENEERYLLISSLEGIELSLNGTPITNNELLTLDIDELHYLYQIATKLEEKISEKKGLKL